MATFITDRTETDVNKSKELIRKVASTAWGSLTATEQNTYLNQLAAYEDKGRFGEASATRIAAYLVEITAMSTRFTAWGTKDFKGDFDYTSDKTMTNLITNGDFTSNTTGWTATYGTIASVSGRCEYTVTSLNASAYIYQTHTTIAGNKYYCAGKIYPKYANTTRFKVGSNNGTEFDITANTWNQASVIITATDTNTTMLFGHYTNTNYIVGDKILYDDVIIIDLTTLYGAGNEPTLEEMDAFMARNFTNSWFNGTVAYPGNYKPVNREHLKAWVDVLRIAYGGNPVDWDFDQKPYLNYEILNRMEYLSQQYYNGDVDIQAEYCGLFECGERFDTFFNII